MNTLYQLKKKATLALDPPEGKSGFTNLRPLTRDRSPWKGPDEYVCTLVCSEEKFVSALKSYGYKPNVLSTTKYLDTDGTELEVEYGDVDIESGSYAFRDSLTGKFMHHTYWFTADLNTEEPISIDVFHHKEWNYLNDLANGRLTNPDKPIRHFSGKRWHGDPDGVLMDAIKTAGLEYWSRSDNSTLF